MSEHQLLVDIRERLVRLEERAEAREHRLLRMEQTVEGLNRFRWWIVGGLAASGGMGGFVASQIQHVL